MSSITGGTIPQFQPPVFNETTGVIAAIESQVGRVSDLFAEVQAILQEIRGLRPPTKQANESPAAFQQRIADFSRQLSRLNHRLEGTYRKLGQAQAKLGRMQTQDLPAAERRDSERMQKATSQAIGALNGASEAIKAAGAGEEEGSTREEIRIEMRVLDRKIDILLAEDPSFKDVIGAFALMANIVGQPNADTPYTVMPSTPGAGLPPVSTP